mmetsp:Transcript_32223/g.32485  ORF Transcript_32223/g.32485 Transcript_32223/m.32485 type:complete len:90 (+) Transcript_32223:266-535(+)
MSCYFTRAIPKTTLVSVPFLLSVIPIILKHNFLFGQLDERFSIRDYVWNDDYSAGEHSDSENEQDSGIVDQSMVYRGSGNRWGSELFSD